MIMDKVLGGVYKLKEVLIMENDRYGYRTSGGTAKVGQLFELIDLPDKKKKKYTLYPIDVKFPYHLYLRENDFERWFEKV